MKLLETSQRLLELGYTKYKTYETRNDRIDFTYILHFYRLGKVLLLIEESLQLDLEGEVNDFQILVNFTKPIDITELRLRHKLPILSTVDNALNAILLSHPNRGLEPVLRAVEELNQIQEVVNSERFEFWDEGKRSLNYA